MKSYLLSYIEIFFVMAAVCVSVERAEAGPYENCLRQCNISNPGAGGNFRTYTSCQANCNKSFQ